MRNFRHPGRPTALTATLVTLATVMSAVLLSPAPALAATTTWRADGFGPQNTGFNPGETAITTATVDKVAYRWSIVSPAIRFPCSRQRPPVVSAGRLFASDQVGISAYRATTGKRLWTVPYTEPEDEIPPTLAVAGTSLIAATSNCISQSDPDGRLIAYDVATGAQRWRVFRDAPMYTLVVDKGIAVVSGEDVFGSQVTAYRISDGTELWTRAASLLEPVSANGRLLLVRAGEEDPVGSDLVDISTGEVLWSSTTEWRVLASGAAGGPLYAANRAGDLARINVETGAVVWSIPGAAGKVAVDGPRLYVAEGSEIGALAEKATSRRRPAVRRAAPRDDFLVARNAATGAELWREEFFGETMGKPVVAGGVVYGTANHYYIQPLDAVTGKSLDFDAPFAEAREHPVIVNGWLYVTSGRVLDAFHL